MSRSPSAVISLFGLRWHVPRFNIDTVLVMQRVQSSRFHHSFHLNVVVVVAVTNCPSQSRKVWSVFFLLSRKRLYNFGVAIKPQKALPIGVGTSALTCD